MPLSFSANLLVLILFFLSPLSVPIHADEDPQSQTTLVTDPDMDCEFSLSAKKISITVPGTIHDLHPARGMNAPCVLRSVTGDFTVQVKVTADFQPGRTSEGRGAPFNGAGILKTCQSRPNDSGVLR